MAAILSRPQCVKLNLYVDSKLLYMEEQVDIGCLISIGKCYDNIHFSLNILIPKAPFRHSV